MDYNSRSTGDAYVSFPFVILPMHAKKIPARSTSFMRCFAIFKNHILSRPLSSASHTWFWKVKATKATTVLFPLRKRSIVQEFLGNEDSVSFPFQLLLWVKKHSTNLQLPPVNQIAKTDAMVDTIG